MRKSALLPGSSLRTPNAVGVAISLSSSPTRLRPSPAPSPPFSTPMAKIPVFVVDTADMEDDELDALADELYDLMVDAVRAHQAEPTGD